jgi:hypothetical protein
MINRNWWLTTLLVKRFRYWPPLDKDITCDVLVVLHQLVRRYGVEAARDIWEMPVRGIERPAMVDEFQGASGA